MIQMQKKNDREDYWLFLIMLIVFHALIIGTIIEYGLNVALTMFLILLLPLLSVMIPIVSNMYKQLKNKEND
jgi:uncharacterized membrane protein YhaH (DUF805 family)